jgi:hypothetical protein
MKPARVLIVAAAVLALSGVAGCGETEQVVVYKQGKYQGKIDTKPWDNDSGAALYTSSKWNKGDKTGWETALRARSLNQNEYSRAE